VVEGTYSLNFSEAKTRELFEPISSKHAWAALQDPVSNINKIIFKK
jgi:hypothetical protein